MKKILLIYLIYLMISDNSSLAIDPHFSQFYASPLTLNPALTGISFGNYRLSTNYRNQWPTIPAFQTYSVSFDMSILENNKKNDFLGAGILVRNDVSGIGFKNSKAMLSLAYHKSLGTHYIALGLQGGIVQKSLNIDGLSSQNQWDPIQGFSSGSFNGENISGVNLTVPDFQAGLLWYTFLGKSSALFSGISIFHVTEPKELFLGKNNNVSRRYVFHGGGRIAVSEKMHLIPNVIFMQQNFITEINLGTAIEYGFSKNTAFSFGTWYRNKDAIILTVGLEHLNLKAGISYDVNVSGLKNATNGTGGFEIALTYIFKKPLFKTAKLSSSPCPRM